MARVRQRLGVSERRACRVLGQARTTHRRRSKRGADEEALREDVVRVARRFGRYGYRMVTGMLRTEGWVVNHKRVERIWRQEGLKVPKKQPRRGRLWLRDGSCIRLRPLYRHHVWAYDFVADRNYHTATAKLYEDFGMLTCDRRLADAAAGVFNELTSAVPLSDYGPLLVAPHNLRAGFTEMIRREAEHCAAGRPSGIRAKMNQLQDTAIIRELYLASKAGVPITLNVRGLCCLRAGVPDLLPTIKVYSTLGRFLEHGRIYRFENGGDPVYLTGSADLMRRNLDSRMETIVPVTDPALRRQLDAILDVYERDNCSAWDMQPDGNYVRRRPAKGAERSDAQGMFIRLAAGSATSEARAPGESHPDGTGLGGWKRVVDVAASPSG